MKAFDEVRTKTPAGFKCAGTITPDSLVFYSNDGGLKIIVAEELHADGHTYLHVSFSRRSRTPSYEDLDWVRKAFIGEERESVQVFPPRAEYVNFHPYTLHLWHCYERRIFPDGAS